jgi:hypothetical protein
VPFGIRHHVGQEVAREIRGQAGGQHRQRNRRGVGRHGRTGLAGVLDPAIERLLDRDVFQHRLDDPIGLGQAAQIVLDIAGLDQPGVARVHQGRGIAFQQLFDRALGDGVAVDGALGHDVEQQHRHAGIGDMRGDAGAHDAGADDRGLGDGHQAASSTVAMP